MKATNTETCMSRTFCQNEMVSRESVRSVSLSVSLPSHTTTTTYGFFLC